jgi:flagellar assembly protein FliH
MTQTLQLHYPLRAVLSPDDAAERRALEQRSREREEAAYERGRREAELSYQRQLEKQEARLEQQLEQQQARFQQIETGLLQALRQAVPHVIHVTENSLVALTMEVARRLIAGLPVSAEMVEAVVREALSQAEQSGEVTIHLHPEDFKLLEEARSPLLAPASSGPSLRFQTSNEVARGGCLVQTRFGVIDACRETKLELLKKSLLP